MKRINIFLILLLSAWIYASRAQERKTQKKPNIIFILTDDLGYGDLGVFFQNQRKQAGNQSEPWLFTPQLDKMAAEGSILTDHYCAAPVCAPSRASILLGVSQGHANVRDNQFDKALEDNYTVANVLQKAGYSTAAIGKWGLQGKTKAPNWPAHPLKRGFDYYYGYIAHGDGHEHYPKEGLYRNPKKVWENYKEVSNDLDKCYTGDLFTAAAKKYIIDHSKGKEAGKPFFMYLAYDTPHAVLELPAGPYPKGSGLKGGIQWLGKPGMMINTATGTPDSYMYPEYANATYDHDANPSTPEVPWPDTYKRYASVNHRIDDQVGDILALLKDLKIDENTMVIFTSDNGPSRESYLPEEYVSYEADFFNNFGPFDGIKRDVLEGGVREPVIVRWPGTVRPSQVVKSPSISYDWLPTFADAAGLKAPVRSDGVSILPSLTGNGKQQKSAVYIEYFEGGKTPDYKEYVAAHRGKVRKQMQLMRLGDTVAIRCNITSASDNFEIYDVSKDPQEKNDLAASEPKLQELLKSRALQMRRPDPGAVRPYDREPLSPVQPGSLIPGLKMKEYSFSGSWIPNITTLAAVATSVTASPKPKGKGNLFFFEGYIRVPADGEYTFEMSADNKAFMRIHDSSVIDEDFGYKPGEIKSGKVILKSGYHPVKIWYMAKPGAGKFSFDLKWSEPGKVAVEVPPGVLFN